MNIVEHNRDAWNRQSTAESSRWCVPVDAATIAAARRGEWQLILTPNRIVPADWYDNVQGKRVLCLASGGGQQAPVLSAAGAVVTSFDASDEQLAKDAQVAAREGLTLTTRRGDMADLSCFADESFELVFHPVSNVFASNVTQVWRECHRVLVPGGRLLSGFMNPDFYLFDHDLIEQGAPLEVSFKLPYSDLDQLPANRLEQRIAAGETLEFSHSLDVQIGGQIDAGFAIHGFYEDRWERAATPLDAYMPTSMATLAIKPSLSRS